ncbi:MAG: bifunctional diaminohydroxyphosphoribosylaminopyrimidine deaminase/5-amino-6-(5-phosphoribosylamino)uracil reductase RibD [Candidatus Eremiobacteraeota bacterium]|nr:bifunctional diaminohydroxyphosphoribosylaminopyrimidine deaminase/5-amino-6-(5-phosphoribosylamino)uracil reductase RibD [Candidatus Eremiobacteraeota bacterium]
MERPPSRLTPLDELYLQRAYELAGRGVGNTAPNPPVGAVLVREGRIVGEGYHRRAGAAHAEVDALREAAAAARGATLYVSLEPCGHIGRTPPCTRALLEAGVARVVAGTLDPTEHGGGAQLRQRGIEVVVAGDATAKALIEPFARSSVRRRPYLAVKMAMSLDGAVASEPGVREPLGSEAERSYVRELRTGYDAVMAGAGTIRIDDPLLTVRPLHDRARPYVRIVACETDGVPETSRVFAPARGYDTTIVLAPDALRPRLCALAEVAEVLVVGEADAQTLDLCAAMEALRSRGVFSVLCEGGPKLAAGLITSGLADRFYWAVAPRFLHSDRAVPVLRGVDVAVRAVRARFDGVQRVGDDVVLSGTFGDV